MIYTIDSRLFTNIFTVKEDPNIIVKTYDSSSQRRKEERRLRSIAHLSNVPKIMGSSKHSIFMSRAPGEDLFSIVIKRHRIHENEVKDIARDLLGIVKELHDLRITHGDIKPENIMYEEKKRILTLVDFEQGRHSEKYAAPECFYDITKCRETEHDIWCIGTTIYTILIGHTPYNDVNHLFSGLSYHDTSIYGLSSDAESFIRFILVKDRLSRPDVHDCLAHQWLREKSPFLAIEIEEPIPPRTNRWTCCQIL